jgi:hypothetical protein
MEGRLHGLEHGRMETMTGGARQLSKLLESIVDIEKGLSLSYSSSIFVHQLIHNRTIRVA